jgi:predicted short-subunit dehydrogenase-like oxidoreductase (DUF2520 family)
VNSKSNPLLWRIVKRVSIIGSGNVATHLAKNLFSNGVTINSVYSPTLSNASHLATQVNANAISDLIDLDHKNIDFIIIAVKDDIIKLVSNQIPSSNAIIAHTSGTVNLSILKKHPNIGVFYPLQTFSKTKELDFSKIPMCIEGNSNSTQNKLIELASDISKDVRVIDSTTRKNIHIAAVFACNFANHMFTVANHLLQDSHQDLSILKPLIQETVEKALSSNPESVQTGPAIRKDYEVLKRHESMLEEHTDLKNLYINISNSIINWKHE